MIYSYGILNKSEALIINLFDPVYSWFPNAKTHALPLIVLKGPNLSSVVLLLMIRVMIMMMTLYTSQSISTIAGSGQDHKNNTTLYLKNCNNNNR